MQSADVVRGVLPSIIPPSYRGAAIRYLYYVRTTLSGRWLILENTHSHTDATKDLIHLVGLLNYLTCFTRSTFILIFITFSFIRILNMQQLLLLLIKFAYLSMASYILPFGIMHCIFPPSLCG